MSMISLLLGSLISAVPTPAEINAIDLSDAGVDDGWVAPVSRNLDHLDEAGRAELERMQAALPPAGEPLAWTFTLLNTAALVDLGRGSREAEMNHVVFDMILRDPRRAEMMQAVGTIALDRDGLHAIAALPALGLKTTTPPEKIHDRIELLARKLIGRLQGRLPTP